LRGRSCHFSKRKKRQGFHPACYRFGLEHIRVLVKLHNNLFRGNAGLVLAVFGSIAITLSVEVVVIEMGDEVINNSFSSSPAEFHSGHVLFSVLKLDDPELQGVIMLGVDKVGVLSRGNVVVNRPRPMSEIAPEQLPNLFRVSLHFIRQGDKQRMIESANISHGDGVDHGTVSDVGMSPAIVVDLQLTSLHQAFNGDGLLRNSVQALENGGLVLNIDGAIRGRNVTIQQDLSAGLRRAIGRFKLDPEGPRVNLISAEGRVILMAITIQPVSMKRAHISGATTAPIGVNLDSANVGALGAAANGSRH